MVDTINSDMRHLLLVDAETLVRSAIAQVIISSSSFKVVEEAGNLAEALAKLEEGNIKVVITEIALPGPSGLELINEITRRKLKVQSLVLSRIDSLDVVRQVLMAGAQGYFLKSDSIEDFIEGLNGLQTSRKILSTSIAGLVNIPANFYEISEDRSITDPLYPLSPREREIFYLLATGLRNSTIAKQLYISSRTVETHRARIVRKLKLDSNGELIRYAIKHGLTTV